MAWNPGYNVANSNVLYGDKHPMKHMATAHNCVYLSNDACPWFLDVNPCTYMYM